VEFRILGPIEAVEGGTSVPLGSPKQRAVLALLLLSAGQVVSVDRLIDQLWGAEPPQNAKTILQGYVSGLRKALGADEIRTQGPGYSIELEGSELDLHRFERMVTEARDASAAGDHRSAAGTLREALGLWRGPALADFAYEPFAQSPTARLEELRLTALEDRIDADLASGHRGDLTGELDAVISEHPLRERPRAQLMLALYRSGRQAEALEAYRNARSVLVDELGIEPTHALQELEKAILRQDAGLDLAPISAPAGTAGTPSSSATPLERAILVVGHDETRLDILIGLAEALARRSPRELILASLVPADGDLARSTASLHDRRAGLMDRGISARAAGFTSIERGADTVRLSAEQAVDLLLLDATEELAHSGGSILDLEIVLVGAPCDVALLVASSDGDPQPTAGRAVLVPFGGSEHEWAAAELGAWLASATDAPLRLIGTAADTGSGKRDASRLLATASLIVQQVAGVPAEPMLIPPGPEAVLSAAADAAVVLLGLSDRWRQEGIGEARLAVARGAKAPTLLVRGGLRPGGLAPRESLTRFTWTLAAAGG
jgi:DNA-binding SARP family transcriptional activator